MKIVLSAGHNPGTDSGAVGQGQHEADDTIRIARRVYLYLTSWGISTDYMPDNVGNLTAEQNWMNARYSDDNQTFGIQIHRNSFSKPATGNEVWSTAYKSQMVLAKSIMKAMTEITKLPERGVRDIKNYSPLGWITGLKCQSVLIESRFMNFDPITDADDFLDAYGIACGIADFLKVPRRPSMEQQQIADARNAAIAQAEAKAEATRLAVIAEKARTEAFKQAEIARLLELAAANALAEKIAADQAKAEAEQALKDAVKTENDNFTVWLKNVFIMVANWLTSWRK